MSFINPFSISFACVAVAFAAGGDYIVQSKAQGSYPGAFPLSAYVDTFGARLSGTKDRMDKKKRQSVLAREHLPDAANGWDRTVWEVGDFDIDALIANMDILAKTKAKEEFRNARKIAREDVWEYRRGAELIRVFVRYDAEPFVTKTPISGWLTERFTPIKKPRYAPYAVVQGVPFLKIESAKTAAPDPLLMLEAHLGENIRLAVAARSSRDSVLELLQGVDFDSLNLMLDESFAAVGRAAPDLTEAQAMILARLHAEARNAKAPISLAEVNADTIRQMADLPRSGAAAPVTEEAEEVAAEPVGQIELNGQGARSDGQSSRLKLSGGGLVQITN